MTKDIRVRKIFSTIFALLFAGILGLTSCGGEETPSNSEQTLIPEIINDSAIVNINEDNQLIKEKINNNVSIYLADGVFYSEEEEELANKLLKDVGDSLTLKAFGDDISVFDFGGYTGVSINGTVAGFTFLQNIDRNFIYDHKQIEITDATSSKAGEYSFATKFGNGGFLIKKSFDAETWVDETSFLSANRYGIAYYPDSSDVVKGVYYRFISAIQFRFFSHNETKSKGKLWWKKTWEEPVFATFNTICEYNVAMARESLSIRFSCGSLEDVEFGGEDVTQEEIDFLQSSTTMLNGSTSTSYIKVELRTVSDKVNYTYIGKDETYDSVINETTTFTKPGKYIFRTITFFGKVNKIELYLVDLGEDKGKSTFFGDGIVDSTMRIYEPSKPVQTYMIGKSYNLKELPEYVPGRYGNLYYFQDDNAFKNKKGQILKTYENSREREENIFSVEGYYVFDLYNCNPETSSGDVLHYQYIYFCSNNKNYAPFVNYGLITNPARSNLLATKVLSVSMPTAGGGMYQFVYPYTEEYVQKAYEMAVKIEELCVEIIEHESNKYYYYKSIDNSNVKINYVDKITLYEVINHYARENINMVYLENDIPFAKEVVDGELKKLNESSIVNTIRVVENSSVLYDLRTDEIYLNNYVFTQVADFEVDSISATGESGNIYNIKFDEEIDSLFKKSEKITISEQNWNGRKTYEAIYSKYNTCEVTVDEGLFNKKYSIANDGMKITTSSFKFMFADDKYDSQTLIAINDGRTRILFSMEEISGLSLPTGEYVITCINRNGQTYSFEVNCTGVLPSNETSINDYNHNPLQRKILETNQTEVVEEDVQQKGPKMVQFRLWVFILIIIGTVFVSMCSTLFIRNRLS